MSWSARQYLAFEDERTRPVRDLVAAIPDTDVHRAIDIGCGPGNSTEVLVSRFPAAALRGLDSSAEMIESARQRLPEVHFDFADIGSWDESGPFDVILANAVLQWLPDHTVLFPRLVAKLTKGGSLAVQMPDNLDEPAPRLMREVAQLGPWADKLADAAGERTVIESPAFYYALLKPHCARVDVWRTTYHHPLAGGAEGIVEWFRGSGLRPFLNRLSEPDRTAYLDSYRAKVACAYPAMADGSVLLPFPRLFIVATR